MQGASSATSVAETVRPSLMYNRSSASAPEGTRAKQTADPGGAGALGLARQALGQVLHGSGFVDITGSLQGNFAMYLTYDPSDAEIEDLEPGAIAELKEWIKNVLAAEPEDAAETQTNVPPEAAVKLLI